MELHYRQSMHRNLKLSYQIYIHLLIYMTQYDEIVAHYAHDAHILETMDVLYPTQQQYSYHFQKRYELVYYILEYVLTIVVAAFLYLTSLS